MKFDGFFVSDEIHEREVTLGDGSKHVLHFRELSVTDLRRFAFAERSDDEEVRAESVAKLIAASLCEADGKPAMSAEQAKRLKPKVADAIFQAVMSVNDPGKA